MQHPLHTSQRRGGNAAASLVFHLTRLACNALKNHDINQAGYCFGRVLILGGSILGMGNKRPVFLGK